jgi:hypothetical protein
MEVSIVDNFREWLSDNLRYILLGLAVILIIVVAVFAVKLIGNMGEKTPDKGSESSSQPAVVVDTETQSESETSSPLVQNDAAILDLVQRYYTAVVSKDIDTLKQIVESLDEDAQQAIFDNNFVESYNNMTVYSKNGPVEGSYVVYACYDGKIIDVDTMAPSLSLLYICTNDDGSLYVADPHSDEQVEAFINKTSAEPDVAALLADVEKRYAEAEESDPNLKSTMKALGASETEAVLPNSDEAGVEANKKVAATDVCYVRSDSVETADPLGMLAVGETVTRIKKLDNGWSEVRYGDAVGYVKSDYLTEDLSSVQNSGE